MHAKILLLRSLTCVTTSGFSFFRNMECEIFIDASSGSSFGGSSSYVDVYNATSNSWTRFPAGLGQARARLAAASLPSGLVFFAGGIASGGKRVFVLATCCSCFLLISFSAESTSGRLMILRA